MITRRCLFAGLTRKFGEWIVPEWVEVADRIVEVRGSTARVGQIHTATDGREILRNSPDGWEVERPWIWWNGPDGDDPPVWGNPPPGADRNDWRRSVPPTLGKCRQLVADALAGVPWKVFRGTERLPVPDWISDPQGLRPDLRVGSSVADVRLSAVEFWSAYLLSVIELGEGIAYCPRVAMSGVPDLEPWAPPLFLLDPRSVNVEDGRYWVDNTEIPAAALVVTRNRVWPGEVRGRGLWEQFARSIGFDDVIDGFTENMLGRGVPAGYLKVNSPDMSQPAADKLKRQWLAAHGGSRRNIAVLNAVTDFQQLEYNPQALQLTEMMKLQAWDIATMYGVPPGKLGISLGSGSTLTYANIESQQIDYVQDALLPWARRIESSFDAKFPRGTELKIVLDGLRRGDTATRYEAHKVGLEAGFLTIDEVRAYEDLPPLNQAPDLPAPNELEPATETPAIEADPDGSENE